MPKYIIKHDDTKSNQDYGITADEYRMTREDYIFEDITPAVPGVPRTPTEPAIPGVPEIRTLVANVRILDVKSIIEETALDPNP